MDIPSLWGIDHTSNIMGQTGGTGVRTMLSEQAATINPDSPRFAGVEATTTSLYNQIITVTEHAAKRAKKEDESTKHKEAAVAADHSRSYFNALTDSQIALSMTIEELSMLAEVYSPSQDDRSMRATMVTWAFGEGSVVGESTLFSDSVIFQIEANADNLVASLDLFDITVYDLTLSLSAGQQYWFSVDTYSYSVFVPAPSSALLAVLGFGIAARRRR
ncbi:MAG: hypothetical protein EA380_00060 [Phycisphaeraceae bacterium]|nr:MAG: hypothetical protein EA380_00060 [Phycisphaeraceae bacterium]